MLLVHTQRDQKYIVVNNFATDAKVSSILYSLFSVSYILHFSLSWK